MCQLKHYHCGNGRYLNGQQENEIKINSQSQKHLFIHETFEDSNRQ